MDHQRRRQSPGHPHRGRRGLGPPAVALVLGLLIASACVFERVQAPRIGSGGASSGGGAGGPAASVVGTWRHIMRLQSSTSDVVITTTWTFSSSGACARTTETLDIVAGKSFTETRTCTYVQSGSGVTVTYDGQSTPVTFGVAFSGGDLLLNGFRFQKVG